MLGTIVYALSLRYQRFLFLSYFVTFRYNAQGLKTIALEYILRNLDNPIVEEGLNVSNFRRVICAFQHLLFLLITSRSPTKTCNYSLIPNPTNVTFQMIRVGPEIRTEFISRNHNPKRFYPNGWYVRFRFCIVTWWIRVVRTVI